MLLRKATWERIREQFTEQEKAVLRQAVQGQLLCPARGWALDDDRIEPALHARLQRAMAVAYLKKPEEKNNYASATANGRSTAVRTD
jgi:hypothetical protein